MTAVNENIREELEKEAARWVEEEMVVRMAYASDAIGEQAGISSFVIGEEGSKNHIKEATAFAEENIRRDLEVEASAWVGRQMENRTRPMLEDRPLEMNVCGD